MYIHTPQEAMYGFLYTFLQMGQNTFIIFDLSPASTTTSCMVCMQGNDTMNGMSCLPRGLIKQTLFQETRTEAHVCTCTWDQLCEVGVYTEVRGGNDGRNMRKSEGMPPSPHLISSIKFLLRRNLIHVNSSFNVSAMQDLLPISCSEPTQCIQPPPPHQQQRQHTGAIH